jgi:DOMON domain.
MGMSKLTYLLLLSLIAVPLSTTEGSPKLNDLRQEGDRFKQDKVLDLLDQYVLHVDRGQTDEHKETMDLLDQYVMHVDRGANVNLEPNGGVKWDAVRQAGGPRNSVQRISKNMTGRDNEKNLKCEREVDCVRRSLHAVKKKDKKELIKPKNRLHSKNGISAKRNIKRGGRLAEAVVSLERKRNENVKENMADVTSLGSKSGHRSKRNVADNGEEIKKEVNVRDSRQRSDDEYGNKIDDSGKEADPDMTSGPWTHSVKLGDFVTLSWRVMGGEEAIEFLVEAATRGYVGVGFSPGGGMAKADIVLSWVNDDDGEIYVVVSLLPAEICCRTCTEHYHVSGSVRFRPQCHLLGPSVIFVQMSVRFKK